MPHEAGQTNAKLFPLTRPTGPHGELLMPHEAGLTRAPLPKARGCSLHPGGESFTRSKALRTLLRQGGGLQFARPFLSGDT